MTLKTGLATALVAAIVAALVTAATLVVIWRAAPGVVDAPAAALDEKTIVDVVRNYLTKNPEILVEMTTELDKRQQAEESAKQQKVISDNADAIFRSPLCLCRRQSQWRCDRGRVLRLQLRLLPPGAARRGQARWTPTTRCASCSRSCRSSARSSEGAAKAALAAGKQGKYFEMHQKLYAAPGKADKEKALRVASELGLDVPQLEKDMEDPSVTTGARRGQGARPEARRCKERRST